MFSIDKMVFNKLPGLRVVMVFADDINNFQSNLKVSEYLEEIWVNAKKIEDIGSHQNIKPWKTSMGNIGVSTKKFPMSVESLLKRTRNKPPLHINPLVDFYNAISIKHVVTGGGFDLHQVLPKEDRFLELRTTREGDRFLALDSKESSSVLPGEIGYVYGNEVITRHVAWKQGRFGLIQPETTAVVLMSEIIGGVDDSVAKQVEKDFVQGLKQFFNANHVSSFILDQHNSFIPTDSFFFLNSNGPVPKKSLSLLFLQFHLMKIYGPGDMKKQQK